MIEYFVHFTFTGTTGTHGDGMARIPMEMPITNMEQILEMAEYIRGSANYAKVVITNYIPLREIKDLGGD